MSAPPLSLKQVRIIEAVARARGFEPAARLLNATQPVISRAIAAAEASLGVTLFQRGWGGTTPTVQGELVVARCANILKLIANAETAIGQTGENKPNLRAKLSWHQLDAVSEVVARGNASAAAGALGVTQPAISRSLALASAYAGTALFERRRRGLEPTSHAHTLAVLHRRLGEELRALQSSLEKASSVMQGRLAVGMLPFSGQEFIAQAFGQMSIAYPDIQLMSFPGSYTMLAEALRRGEIDCMMGILRDPSPVPQLTEIHLYDERFVILARRDHPCHDRKLTLSDLRFEKWLGQPHGTPSRAFFEALFAETGDAPPAQTFEIHSFTNAESVIVNSNSLALLCYSSHHLGQLLPELRVVDVELPEAHIPIGLTVRSDDRQSEILRGFEYILREFIWRKLAEN